MQIVLNSIYLYSCIIILYFTYIISTLCYNIMYILYVKSIDLEVMLHAKGVSLGKYASAPFSNIPLGFWFLKQDLEGNKKCKIGISIISSAAVHLAWVYLYCARIRTHSQCVILAGQCSMYP